MRIGTSDATAMFQRLSFGTALARQDHIVTRRYSQALSDQVFQGADLPLSRLKTSKATGEINQTVLGLPWVLT